MWESFSAADFSFNISKSVGKHRKCFSFLSLHGVAAYL